MKTPFWFDLLEFYCDEKSGLTLPFLVGASAIQRHADARPENARAIYSEMSEKPWANSMFIISFCQVLQAPVITLVHDYGTGVKICLNKDWGSDDEAKLNAFLLDAEAHIRSGHFSRIRDGNTAKWTPFQKSDCDFINSVIRTY